MSKPDVLAPCKLDLEGIVAKHGDGPYITDPQQTTWFKIRSRNYSQMEGAGEAI
jgi:ATP-dependent DNA ligase